MNTPKKPGTDLAALKARLAKKGKEGEEPAPQAAAVEEAPPVEAAPAHYDPQPVQQAAPAPVEHYDPPPQPTFAPEPVRAPSPGYGAPAPAVSDDPFAGPPGGFDPGPALDMGDVPQRSNVGVIAFAGVIFLAVGLGVGWMGQRILSGRERLEAAKAKGDEMYKEVQKVSDTRKGVALKLDEVQKVVMTDPAAGATAIKSLLSESFDKHPEVSNLFGWQLGAIATSGVKKVFELFDRAEHVKSGLQDLAVFLETNKDALGASGGPSLFGVKFQAEGPGQMVAVTGLMCGENPADAASLKDCDDPATATAYKVVDGIGAAEKVVPKGTAADQVTLIAPAGGVYTYAVGQEPAKNAARMRDFLMKGIADKLAEMSAAETTALKALENYASNPDVDGSNPQPEP